MPPGGLLALFEEGTKLIAACSQELDQAEQKVVKLMKGPDGARWSCPLGGGGGMSEQVFQTRYETYRTAVESYLETLFAGRPDWRDLYESMRYSLLAGGKRIRPVLTLEFARLAGLADWKTALPWPAPWSWSTPTP